MSIARTAAVSPSSPAAARCRPAPPPRRAGRRGRRAAARSRARGRAAARELDASPRAARPPVAAGPPVRAAWRRPRRARPERRLLEDLGRRPGDRVGDRLVAGERVDRGHERRGVRRRGLHVERADLHRPEPRVRAQLPPVERVVGTSATAVRRRVNAVEVVVVAHLARRARSRPRAQRDLARRGEAGVAAVAERRVRGERLQQRQVAAQAVEHADRGLGVGHAHVDVDRRDRRRERVAEQVADQLVALLVGDLRVALARRSGACPTRRSPMPVSSTARRRPASTSIASATSVADVGDQLDLAGVDLALDLAARRAPAAGRAASPPPFSSRPSAGSTSSSSSSTPSVNGSPAPKRPGSSGSRSELTRSGIPRSGPGDARRR